jgi:hypothetical protein
MSNTELRWPEAANPLLEEDAEYAAQAETRAVDNDFDMDSLNDDARKANLIWVRAYLHGGVDPETELLEGYAFEESEVATGAVHEAWKHLSLDEKEARLVRQ